ncbi:MAG: hypothetical protein IJ197_08690 [Bacteroidaceae bacterium]|nr:hypothetical protein [Bacteroidaceae bacterium]
MYNDEDRKWLFDKMKSAGVNTGSYDDFTQSLSNKEDRDWYYNKSKELKLDIGSPEDFESMMVEPIAQPVIAGGPSGNVFTESELKKMENGGNPKAKSSLKPTKGAVSKPSAQMPGYKQPVADFMKLDTRDLNTWKNPMGKVRDVRQQQQFSTQKPGEDKTVTDVVKAVKGDEAAAKRVGRQKAMQQIRDRIDYARVSGGKELQGIIPNSEILAPTVLRDEEGNPILGEDGEPLTGVTGDQARVNAQKHEHAKYEEAEYNSLSSQMERAQQELADIQDQIDALKTPYGVKEGEANRMRDLVRTREQIERRIAGLEIAQAGGERGFWSGLLGTGLDLSTWAFGLDKLGDASRMLSISEKMKRGEDITTEEQALLDATLKNQEVQQRLDDDSNFMFRAGRMTAEMFPFMLSIGLTGGMSGVAGIGVNAGRQAALRYAENFGADALRNRIVANMLKGTGALVGDLMAGYAMGNTVGIGNTMADVLNRRIGRLTYAPDGSITFEGGKSWAEALYQGETAQALEYGTEMMGEHIIDPALKMIARQSKNLGFMRGLSRIFTGEGGPQMIKTTYEWLNKMGVQGLPSEGLEEEVNMLLGIGLHADDTDEQVAQFLDKDTHKEIWGGMGLSIGFLHGFGAGMQGLSKTYNTANYYRYKRKAGQASRRAVALLGKDVWAPLQERIDNAPNEEMGKVYADVLNDASMNPRDKEAVLDYMVKLTEMRGYNLGRWNASQEAPQPSVREEEQIGEQLAESNSQGYDATEPEDMQDIQNRMEILREELGDELLVANLDNDPVGTLASIEDNDTRNKALQYTNARAAYNGLLQRIGDDIESNVRVAHEVVESNVDKHTNQIRPAILKHSQRPVYIVDDTNSYDNDSSIIVKDAETGKLEFVSLNDIASIGQPLDPEQEKQRVETDIRNQIAQQEVDKVNGVLTMSIGDVYDLIDQQGNPHQVQILADNGDGTVQAVVDGKQNEAFPKQVIQDMADLKNRARAQEQYSAIASQPTEEEIQPIGKSIFGNLYDQFRGRAKDAVSFLLNRKEGNAIAALRHKDVGDIDLWYGDDKAGLKKIAEKHPEVLNDLQGIIDRMHVVRASENRVILESGTHRAVISKDWYGKKADNWLLTAYEKKGTSGGSIDIVPEPEGKQNGTAPLQDSFSGDKVTENTGNEQNISKGNAMPMVGEGENAEPNFLAVTPERGHQYIYNEAGLDQEEAGQFIEANKKAADNALKKALNSKPNMGTSLSKYNKAKAEWQERVNAAQSTADYWNSVAEVEAELQQSRDEEAQRRLWSTPEGRAQALSDVTSKGPKAKAELARRIYGGYFNSDLDVPGTIEELVAMLLPYGSLNWEGYDRGTHHVRGLQEELGSNHRRGLDRNADSNAFNSYLAKKGEGMSVEELAEQMYSSPENMQDGEHPRWEDSEIRSAILDVLMNAGKSTDIRDYVLNSRINAAEEALRAEEEAAEAAKAEYAEAMHMTPDEVDLWQDYLAEEIPSLVAAYDEIYPIFAEDIIENINNDGEQQSSRSEGLDSQSAEGGNQVLDNGSQEEVREPARSAEVVAEDNEQEGPVGTAENVAVGESAPADVLPEGERVNLQEQIANAEAEVDTNPTEAQKDAGNYKKGHVNIDGFNFTIENPKGSERSGVDADGKAWSQTMNNTYGYIRGSEGVDGDHIDMFLSDDPSQGDVYVIDQVKKDGSFDEHKVMYGFGSEQEARDAYLSNYEEGWQGLGNITHVSKGEFKKWVESSHRKTKPFAEYKSVTVTMWKTKKSTLTDANRSETTPISDLGELSADKVTENLSNEQEETEENANLSDEQRKEIAKTVKGFEQETQEDFIAFERRVNDMSDAELLAYIEAQGLDETKADHPSVYDAYDARHGKEYVDYFDMYADGLHDSTRDRVEEILAQAEKEWEKGGFSSEMRTQLSAQIDACREWLDREEGQSGKTILFREGNDKTLAGFHNISSDKLKKALKQGGLANPSMAVVNTEDRAHTDYGDISLIAPSRLINARTGMNVGTYAGDAWTPTYPSVTLFFTPKGEKHRQAIAKENANGDKELENHLLHALSDYIDGNGDRLHFLFLAQKGLNPEIAQERTTHSHEEYEAVKKIFGEGTSTLPSDFTKEQSDALLALMMSEYEKKVREDSQKISDEAKREAAVEAMLDIRRKSLTDDNGKLWFAKGDNYVHGVWKDEQRRKNPKTDWYPSGNRRYVPNTLENVSRLMNKEQATNAYDNGGLSATRARLLQRFTSLAQIRKNKDLLNSDEEVEKRSKEMSDELFDIIHQISDMQKIDDNPFSNLDYAERRLQEAMTMRNPIRYLNKEYGYDIAEDSELASQIMNFIEEVKALPVKYFETKFNRPVYLNEFAVAVVPDDLDADMLNQLRQSGLDVRTYKSGDIEDRKRVNKEAVEGRSDILFREGEPDYSTMSEPDLDKEYMEALNVVEKPQRIEKLRKSEPVEITGEEYRGQYELNRDSAKKYIKEHLRGNYQIDDTGETILLAKDGAQKVTSHSMGNEAHLKSIAAIPQLLKNAIYITELPNEKGNGKYDMYRYYVCGLRIGGEDYTAKIVIGVDANGKKFYDHSLTEIEKGKLIDEVGALSTTLPSDNESSSISVSKDTKLLSILQTNPEEIARAEEKMRSVLDEMARRRGYTSSSDYQGSLAFNGAAPSKNAYFETKEERKKAFANGDFEGDYSLGDFVDNGLDNHDLEWQIDNPIPASGRDKATLASLNNLRSAVKGKKRTIKMYRAVDASVKEDSFRNGDWVTPSREYAEQHIGLQDWKKGRIIEQEVSIDDVWWNGDDINEWGYDDGKGYAYKNTANNRKLTDLVTRDDAGNVIPPSKRFDERSQDVRFREDEEAPIFISNARHAVEGIKQEKAKPEQWLAMIEKNGGMKAGEDKWLGLSDWLKGQGKKTLTKQEVLDYIRENQIEVQEVHYSEDAETNAFLEYRKEYKQYYDEAVENGKEDPQDVAWERMIEEHGEDFGLGFYALGDELQWDNDSDYTQWEYEQGGIDKPINSTRLDYTTEGLKNKREIALTVPTVESWNEGDEVHFGDADNGTSVAWIRFGETTDADGNRVLVIDEIQSKRHQEGREKGYRTAEAIAEEERLGEEVNKAQEAYDAYTRKMSEKYDGAYEDIFPDMAEAERQEADRLEQAVYAASERLQNHDVSDIPDAPFEKNWHELAMKRMLRYAAENGYDKIAWTTGTHQARRYDIGKDVEKIISYDYPSVKDADGRKSKKVEIRLRNGDTMTMRVGEDGRVIEGRSETEGKMLSDVVGKDLAKRIMEGEGKDGSIFDADRDLPAKVIDGDGLRIGAEGMKGFYDEILPRFMNKYGKKWGVKVGEVELEKPFDADHDAPLKWHSVDVNPEMKESVMQGQTMFRPGGLKFGDKASFDIHLAQNPDGGPLVYKTDVLPDVYPSPYNAFAAIRNHYPEYLVQWDEQTDKVTLTSWRSILGSQEQKPASKTQQRKEDAYAKRVKRNMRKKAEDMVEKLHISDDVLIVDNASELPDEVFEGMSSRTKKKTKRSKGWFDPTTGKIILIIGNNRSEKDILETVMHEGVAHYGLRKLFGEHFDTFLDEVHKHADKEVKDRINQLAFEKYDFDLRAATEEYLASLAEMTDFERPQMQSWWKRVRELFDQMLVRLGLGKSLTRSLDDNDLRYILWRSYHNLELQQNGLFGVADDIAMQQELKVRDFAVKATPIIKNDFRISNGEEIPFGMKIKILDAYNVVKDKHPGVVALIRTPYGYVAINKDAAALRKAFNLPDGPYILFDEEVLDKALSKLISRGNRVALTEVATNEAVAEKVSEPNVRFREDGVREEVEKFTSKYNSKPISFFSLSMSDEELIDALDIPKEYRKDEDIKELRKYFETEKPAALFDRKTEKIYIFADELKPEKTEETLFHENLHASLHEMYEDGMRNIAERFWNIAPDEGKVKRSFVEKKYKDEDEKKEELFVFWLSRSMRDGDVDDMLNMFDDEGDVIRIETFLRDIGYDKERESAERKQKERRNNGVHQKELDGVQTVGGRGRREDGFLNNKSFMLDEGAGEAENYDAGPLTFEESITKAMLELSRRNKQNLQNRMDAIAAIKGNLQQLRMAMARQREYDRSTVNDIVRLVRMLMDTGFVSDMTTYEVRRLLAMVNSATGREDISQQADKILDLITSHQIRQCKSILGKQISIRASKVNQSGVEVQGKLDVEGQRMVNALKEGMGLYEATIDERMSECLDKMGDASDEVAQKNAALEYQGLMLAKQYLEDVKASEQEEKDLKHALSQADEERRAGRFGSYDQYKEYVQSLRDSIMQNRLERVEAYRRLFNSIGDNLRDSVKKAWEFRERETARANEILHMANSDLEGMSASEHSSQKWWESAVNWSWVRGLMKPLATFDEMLRFLGRKSVDGRGYLWNRFFRDGFVKANDTAWRNLKKDHEELDAKVRDLFNGGTYIDKNGKTQKMPKINRWSDLFSLERDMPTADVGIWDAGETKTYTLTAGNLLYIYMVNKMSDGRMKLRRMGISEADVEAIKQSLDPRLIELADWMQNDYLVGKRNTYNEVHERLFGAPMASIDNYFPLKVNKRSRMQEIDPTAYTGDGDAKPSDITGAIIKRKKNTTPLDITNADAFDVMLEHLEQMEHWAAFAELSHDLKTLLSYKTFRNRLENMSSVRFGSGDVLWNNFKTACAIACGVYRPKIDKDSIDTSLVNVAKGVTAAKISLRLFTAFKQLLSYPAYLSEANIIELAKTTNPVGAAKAWNWAIENLPGFAERWQSRQAGDSRLMKTDSDWGLWREGLVKEAARIGMSPNAFVDALTVVMGAKAIYETKLKQYKKDGHPADVAKERALLDASIAYNETQQSSESGYLSAMQLDRTLASVALTVFRNSSMGYQRRLFRSLDNLKEKMKPGYREETIEYMRKQMERDGLTPEQAGRAAKRAYRRSWVEDVVNTLIFGYGIQFAWNLGSYIPYLLFGDDDDKKKEFLDDAAIHAFAGGVEGLSGGSIMSELANMGMQIAMADDDSEKKSLKQQLMNYDFNTLPVLSDMQTMLRHFGSDEVQGWNDIVNLLIQSGIGVNPQTITDAALAIEDAVQGDLGMGKEIGMFLMRLAAVPQSQLDELYLDEVGLIAKDAKELSVEELAQRYAIYKRKRGAYSLRWAYDDEEKAELEEKYVKRFNKRLQERIAGLSEDGKKEAFEDADDDDDIVLKNIVAKEIAKSMELQDYFAKSNPTPWQEEYQRERNFYDHMDDLTLDVAAKAAKDANDSPRIKQIANMKKNLNNIRKALVLDVEGREENMERLRNLRGKYLEALDNQPSGAVVVEIEE